ncbi:unnamed protein product, partial [Prorocentrum cordatum]
SAEAIESIRRSVPAVDAEGMTPRQRAVYAYAAELHGRRRVGEGTHAAALAAVGGERALVDLVLTMGVYSQISMQLNAFAVPLPPGEAPPFPEPPAE